jgi:hypothetical protein
MRASRRRLSSSKSRPHLLRLLDGEGFILQVHRVFTCIRPGAAVVAIRGGAPGSTIYTEVEVCTGGGFRAIFAFNGSKCAG